MDIQVAFGRSLEGVLGFPQAIERNIVHGKVVIPDGKVRIEFDGFLGFFEALSYLPRVCKSSPPRNRGAVPHEDRFAPTPHRSVAPFPGFPSPDIVGGGDEELLPVAGAIPQLPGSAGALRGERSDSSRSAYMRPSDACAIANLGSISVARLKSGRAAAAPLDE